MKFDAAPQFEGNDFRIYEIDNHILRVPKNDSAKDKLITETALLEILKKELNIKFQIPEFEIVDNGSSVKYKKIT